MMTRLNIPLLDASKTPMAETFPSDLPVGSGNDFSEWMEQAFPASPAAVGMSEDRAAGNDRSRQKESKNESTDDLTVEQEIDSSSGSPAMLPPQSQRFFHPPIASKNEIETSMESGDETGGAVETSHKPTALGVGVSGKQSVVSPVFAAGVLKNSAIEMHLENGFGKPILQPADSMGIAKKVDATANLPAIPPPPTQVLVQSPTTSKGIDLRIDSENPTSESVNKTIPPDMTRTTPEFFPAPVVGVSKGSGNKTYFQNSFDSTNDSPIGMDGKRSSVEVPNITGRNIAAPIGEPSIGAARLPDSIISKTDVGSVPDETKSVSEKFSGAGVHPVPPGNSARSSDLKVESLGEKTAVAPNETPATKQLRSSIESTSVTGKLADDLGAVRTKIVAPENEAFKARSGRLSAFDVSKRSGVETFLQNGLGNTEQESVTAGDGNNEVPVVAKETFVKIFPRVSGEATSVTERPIGNAKEIPNKTVTSKEPVSRIVTHASPAPAALENSENFQNGLEKTGRETISESPISPGKLPAPPALGTETDKNAGVTKQTSAVTKESSDAIRSASTTLPPRSLVDGAPSSNHLPDSPTKDISQVEVRPTTVRETSPKAFQIINHSGVAISADDSKTALPPDGKETAKQQPLMRFAEEQNKFAESTLQKLPHLGLDQNMSVASAGKVDAKILFAPVERGEKTTLNVPALDLMTALGSLDSVKNSLVASGSEVDQAQRQVDRLAGLVSAEVLTFKQTGVNGLTISLKLDARTEISLGLTHRDGQIQASIRCERGDLSEAENHWGQLQESLARHNVQLLPLQQNGLLKSAVPNFPAEASQHFDQPQQRRDRDSAPQFVSEEPASNTTVRGGEFKKINPVVGRRGWESWA